MIQVSSLLSFSPPVEDPIQGLGLGLFLVSTSINDSARRNDLRSRINVLANNARRKSRPSRIYRCTRRHWTRKWMKVDRPPPAFQKPGSPLLIHEFCFSPLSLSSSPPFSPTRLILHSNPPCRFESFFRKRVTLFRRRRRIFVNYSSITEWNAPPPPSKHGMKRILLWRVRG